MSNLLCGFVSPSSHSGYYMYHLFSIQELSFLRVPPSNDNLMVCIYPADFVLEKECVYCAVRLESLNICQVNILISAFPCHYRSTNAPHSSSSTCCRYQRDKRANSVNLKKRNASLEIWEHQTSLPCLRRYSILVRSVWELWWTNWRCDGIFFCPKYFGLSISQLVYCWFIPICILMLLLAEGQAGEVLKTSKYCPFWCWGEGEGG